MPEGHTIHRLARDLSQEFAGKIVRASSPQARFPDAKAIDKKKLVGAHAVGKHLFLDYANARVHIHLGLFGKFKRTTKPPRDSVRLRLEAKDAIWELTGPTACHLVDEGQYDALRDRLGADPLAPGRRPTKTWERIHGSKRPIGALLLDQSILAGIGNVYRAELLFLVGVHPDTPGSAIEKATFDRLWKLARELLLRGVALNRIVTVPGGKGRDRLFVYAQRQCRVCATPIARKTNALRTIYFCPTCQRAPREP